MLLVVDNHDSFTWNLVHALGQFASDVLVKQGDALTLDDVRALAPRGIVLSPGPGRPEHAGIGVELVRALAALDGCLHPHGDRVPLFGVCLGHQIICTAFGARVVHAPRLMHGRTSRVRHDGAGVFRDLPNPLTVARYHSLLVEAESLPAMLHATAHSEEGELMAVRHATLPIESVQFHPESFLTEHGGQLVRSFVSRLAAG